jgi:hypothetical protein
MKMVLQGLGVMENGGKNEHLNPTRRADERKDGIRLPLERSSLEQWYSPSSKRSMSVRKL